MLAFALLLPVAASAATEQLCLGQDVAASADGRMLGHVPYGQASNAELVDAPPGFAIGQPCRLRPEAAASLARMLRAAAATPGMAGRLRSVSCYRTIAHQRAVFCSQIGPRKRCRNAAERARAVGPPGYSEHATGYAIDFATRPSPGCGDVSACFARTTAGLWLLAHAGEFGFELSFPAGNAQGVTWEPWHWRWVGATAMERGALAARTIFARARRDFPALPTVPDAPPAIDISVPPPALLSPPAPAVPPATPAGPMPAPMPTPAPTSAS